MKKILILLMFTILISIENCLANEIFYQNDNGVILTEKEYNFITDLYYDGYQKNLTKEEYEYYKINDIFNRELKTAIASDGENIIMPRSTHETASKILKLTAACSDTCFMATTLQWKTTPKVKSYDVIGARFDRTSYVSELDTEVDYGPNKQKVYEHKTLYNGVGSSLKLPSTSEMIKVIQRFKVARSGTVYASYQHATQSVTLANSKNYTFSDQGLGGVFKFGGSIGNSYDKMKGVSLNLN